MAKKQQVAVAVGKLAGKKFALVGTFGYGDMDQRAHIVRIEDAGGTLVDAAKKQPDCLLVGEGRGGKPPGDVAKLQKKWPELELLKANDLLRLLLPDREELLRAIASGRQDYHFWDELELSCRQSSATIDLQKARLAKADLYGAKLESVVLTGADLRGTNVQYTHFGAVDAVNFDGCDGEHVHLTNAKNCTFRKARLVKAWMFYGGMYGKKQTVEDCDFSGATLPGARLEGGAVANCKFVSADLSDADMEESKFDRVDFSKANLRYLHAGRKATFTACKFAQADLTRADLRQASLVGADLRNAKLCAAVLSGADLSNANVDGADFQDAVLSGAKLTNVDFSKAKNYQPPVARKAGPKLSELAASSKGTKLFSTTAQVDLGKDEFAVLSLGIRNGNLYAASQFHHHGDDTYDNLPGKTIEQSMLNLADRWPKTKLRLDNITASGSKTLRGAKLQELAVAAWAETFGVISETAEALQSQREQHRADTLHERDALMKKIRTKGSEVWNVLDYRVKDRIDLTGANLSGAKLEKLEMRYSSDLTNANFAGSTLTRCEFGTANLSQASFAGAKLDRCELQGATLRGANFRDATLLDSNLSKCKLSGADFTGATIKGINFSKAQYDQTTLFPAGFKVRKDMIWKGEGRRPNLKKAKAAQRGTLDFESFLKKLAQLVEADRLKKTGAMLKAERFQLFAETDDDHLTGVVKSQTSKELVYSCLVTSEGAFGCCTQNLKPCGGLRGALCKHLLVLVIGLAKAERIDAATVYQWIDLSQGQKPAIDAERMGATFLKYKGAEAGEVDWRPTETIPEDFYAM